MIQILSSITPLFILLFVGVLARLLKIADLEWVKVLNKFALYLGFIPLMIYSIGHADKASITNTKLILVNFGVILIIIFATLIVTKLLKMGSETANAYILGIFFGNTAYLGLPFIAALYPGSEGLISVHIAIYSVLLLSIGTALVKCGKLTGASCIGISKKLITDPLLISIFVGFFLLYFDIALPKVIDESLRLLSSSLTPVVLVALGIFVGQKMEFNKDFLHAGIITFCKLIISPILFLIAWKVFGFGSDFKISILESAMPVGIMIFALADVHGLKKQIVANAVILSTLASCVTLTILAALVQ